MRGDVVAVCQHERSPTHPPMLQAPLVVGKATTTLAGRHREGGDKAMQHPLLSYTRALPPPLATWSVPYQCSAWAMGHGAWG